MPHQSDPAQARALRTEKEVAKQEDDNWLRLHLPQWLDAIVQRLFLALERELTAIEGAPQESKSGEEKNPPQNRSQPTGMEIAIRTGPNRSGCAAGQGAL